MTMAEGSEYVLEPLREGADFTVYRGRRRGNPSPILAIASSGSSSLTAGTSRTE